MQKHGRKPSHHGKATLAALLVGMVLPLEAMDACPALFPYRFKMRPGAK